MTEDKKSSKPKRIQIDANTDIALGNPGIYPYFYTHLFQSVGKIIRQISGKANVGRFDEGLE